MTNVETSTKSISYQYNADGIRTQKTVGSVTTDFFLDGSRIVAQKSSDNNKVMWFYYDANGTRDAVKYNGEIYYYFYNGQGDVLGMYDNDLNVVALYTYDSWGVCSATNGSGGTLAADSIGALNPFRYRGYYYETETGFYYLQSRYYDPNTGRFISADDVEYLGANETVDSYNLFAYCGNDPVNMSDPSGKWPQFIVSFFLKELVKGFAVSFV